MVGGGEALCYECRICNLRVEQFLNLHQVSLGLAAIGGNVRQGPVIVYAFDDCLLKRRRQHSVGGCSHVGADGVQRG